MSIGGRRVVRVPASLGFGNSTVLAPYALVPAGATLRYDIELIRLSDRGPDELTSVGGMGTQVLRVWGRKPWGHEPAHAIHPRRAICLAVLLLCSRR